MVSITINNKSLAEQSQSMARVLFVEDGFSFNADLTAIEKECAPLKQLLAEKKFTGKALSMVRAPLVAADHVTWQVIMGLGAIKGSKKIDIEVYRRALGKIMRLAEDNKWTSLVIQLPKPELFGVTARYLAEQTACVINMAHYYFDIFITDESRRIPQTVSVTLALNGLDDHEVEEGLKKGTIVGNAINDARHWIDLPPSMLTPENLANHARDIAQKFNMPITVFSEQEINKMGMGGLSAVSRGSELDCQLVIMEYRAPQKDAPTIAFVGKGITFDSGGLSIKPANSMETMKADMAGAAAVIATMRALGQLKPAVNVIALAPISENLPSGSATKPGDVCRFYNGKTAEIKNTDAEGRLILADALSYVVKHYKPDAIIDIATLTGSCAAALGPFFCGMMSQHDELVAVVQESSNRSGDRVWRLPLHDDYIPAIKSAVADISNIGSPRYMAGAITAAHFLKNFVDDVPWVHLDIAGVDLDVPDIPYYRAASASGFGVRLLTDIAMNWKK
ncbi:hypothetical protein Noda2021_04580 [Candidatus Dependentiae bacterium Noda2021]|nr:hypothetical protein Noda2021_04580 [Candidatus Dependentiae bacterium Noda2021]